eukprot:1194986-Prorocentrum_minimum.AAC.4
MFKSGTVREVDLVTVQALNDERSASGVMHLRFCHTAIGICMTTHGLRDGNSPSVTEASPATLHIARHEEGNKRQVHAGGLDELAQEARSTAERQGREEGARAYSPLTYPIMRTIKGDVVIADVRRVKQDDETWFAAVGVWPQFPNETRAIPCSALLVAGSGRSGIAKKRGGGGKGTWGVAEDMYAFQDEDYYEDVEKEEMEVGACVELAGKQTYFMTGLCRGRKLAEEDAGAEEPPCAIKTPEVRPKRASRGLRERHNEGKVVDAIASLQKSSQAEVAAADTPQTLARQQDFQAEVDDLIRTNEAPIVNFKPKHKAELIPKVR